MLSLEELLEKTTPVARDFFTQIRPLLEEEPHYGWLEYEDFQLADKLHISRYAVVWRLEILRKKGVLKQNGIGTYYCPALIATMVRETLKGRLRQL